MKEKRGQSLQVKAASNLGTELQTAQTGFRRKSNRILRSLDPNINSSQSHENHDGSGVEEGSKSRKSIRFTVPTDGRKSTENSSLAETSSVACEQIQSAPDNGRLSVGSVDENAFRNMIRHRNYSTPLHKGATSSLENTTECESSIQSVSVQLPYKSSTNSKTGQYSTNRIGAPSNFNEPESTAEKPENEVEDPEACHDSPDCPIPPRSLRPRKREVLEKVKNDLADSDVEEKEPRKRRKKQAAVRDPAVQEAVQRVLEVERKLIEDFDAVNEFELCIE